MTKNEMLILTKNTNKQSPNQVKDSKFKDWPFPAATGAVPWSKKQINTYNKSIKYKNKSALPETPF
jgi:hypothetical protein